mmetsp:Transcript_70995/g.148514  ORF Transcript_70995/g.148514 Transcript_70995/m.148514 type:complete len:407 (+) Transcript_70995:1589-2809(+)
MVDTLLFEEILEFLYVCFEAVVALPCLLLLALLLLELVPGDLQLDVGLLGLLSLLQKLLFLVLQLSFEPVHLVLARLDPIFPAAVQALDVLVQLLHQLLEALLLLGHALEVGLCFAQLRFHLLERLLSPEVFAPAYSLLDQLQLMVPALHFPLQRKVLLRGGLHFPKFHVDLLVLLSLRVDLLLAVRKFLQPHEQVSAARRRAARNGSGRIVQVSILGDRSHTDIRVEGDLFGSLGCVADQESTENKLHGTLHILLETYDLHRQVQVASLRHDRLGLAHHVVLDAVVDNLVERNDRHPSLELAFLEQGLASLLVVDDDEEQPAAGAHFQSTMVGLESGLDVEEFRDNSLDLGAVEALVGISVGKVYATQLGSKLIQALLDSEVGALALLVCRPQSLESLRIELHLA